MATPAGWYPDPEQPEALRWWDGEQWAASQANGGPVPEGDVTAGTQSADAAVDAGVAPVDDTVRFSPQAAAAAEASAVTPADTSVPAAGGVDVPVPSWEQPANGGAQASWGQSTDATAQPAWGQPADNAAQPAWGQPADNAAQPAWGQPTESGYGQQQYGGQYDSSTAVAQPGQKKSKTGLIIGIVGGAVALIALIIVGIIIAVNVIGGAQGPNNTASGDPGTGTTFPYSETASVPPGGSDTVTFTVVEAGTYVVAAQSTNSADGKIELTGNGMPMISDDDSGSGLDPLIETQLQPGTYTVTITEYWDSAWEGTVTISRR